MQGCLCKIKDILLMSEQNLLLVKEQACWQES